MDTWTFAAHTTFHGAPIAMRGTGKTEEEALNDALSSGVKDVDYRNHDGYHYIRSVSASHMHSLTPSETILGGRGGWVATYRWPGMSGSDQAVIWIHHGKHVA